MEWKKNKIEEDGVLGSDMMPLHKDIMQIKIRVFLRWA